MATASHLAFEQAIMVVPRDSNVYTANLKSEWAIGDGKSYSVKKTKMNQPNQRIADARPLAPHGGYLAAIFHRLATTHFCRRHHDRHGGAAEPINMQLMFARRCHIGEAILEVEDLKLGTKTSAIRAKLLQRDRGSSSSKLVENIVAHIIVSKLQGEEGFTLGKEGTSPALSPRITSYPLEGNLDDGSRRMWTLMKIPHPHFRRAPAHVRAYVPKDSPRQEQAGFGSEQWAALGGQEGNKTGRGRWTNESATFLLDVFPATLAHLEKEVNKIRGEMAAPVWFPTLALTIDFRKSIPPKHGLKWLHSLVRTESIRNGRMDIKIVLRDQDGDLVALATHSTLIMTPKRNDAKI